MTSPSERARSAPRVISVNRAAEHNFSKAPVAEIALVAGEGVVGDAHRGEAVQHRSRIKPGAAPPNLRQVHLLHMELIEELQAAGFRVNAGTIGENITTSGLDVLALPEGTILVIGNEVKLEVTGLRNPCYQLDDWQKGLMAAVLGRDANGALVRKSGIMSVVLRGGVVRAGDAIAVEYPLAPHRPLQPV
jgi:MOSC domain-containing protein YiiM